ncbi:unnamed protein product, partial [Phaeothamnion confervicola]
KEIVVNPRLTVVAIALSTLVAGHALAADPAVGKTREQVRAELNEAIRTGDIVADGATGQRLNQLYPSRYAQPVVVASKSRADVRAEVQQARLSGELVTDGETGEKIAEYVAPRSAAANTAVAAASGKTRAEVKAELAEAIRNGDLVADGETGAKFNQLYPNRYPQPVLAQGKTREDVR